VQFHPEFDVEIMRAYLVERADTLRVEGLDPCQEVRDCPWGAKFLRRFAQIAGRG
jgi:hypothetical protein